MAMYMNCSPFFLFNISFVLYCLSIIFPFFIILLLGSFYSTCDLRMWGHNFAIFMPVLSIIKI